MDVSNELKDLFSRKLSKFDKFFNDDATAYITLSRKRNLECLELTISSGGILFRSEEAEETFQNALDKAIDVIERQIRKNKTRLEKKLRDGAFPRSIPEDVDFEEEPDFKIRVKTFEVLPMSPDEAILQMNLLNHSFYMFRNSETDTMNVVYKRSDGNYGMLVPSFM